MARDLLVSKASPVSGLQGASPRPSSTVNLFVTASLQIRMAAALRRRTAPPRRE
jgi:hypothetical protein